MALYSLGQPEDDPDLYLAAGHLALSRLAWLHLQVLQGDKTATISKRKTPISIQYMYIRKSLVGGGKERYVALATGCETLKRQLNMTG